MICYIFINLTFHLYRRHLSFSCYDHNKYPEYSCKINFLIFLNSEILIFVRGGSSVEQILDLSIDPLLDTWCSYSFGFCVCSTHPSNFAVNPIEIEESVNFVWIIFGHYLCGDITDIAVLFYCFKKIRRKFIGRFNRSCRL